MLHEACVSCARSAAPGRTAAHRSAGTRAPPAMAGPSPPPERGRPLTNASYAARERARRRGPACNIMRTAPTMDSPSPASLSGPLQGGCVRPRSARCRGARITPQIAHEAKQNGLEMRRRHSLQAHVNHTDAYPRSSDQPTEYSDLQYSLTSTCRAELRQRPLSARAGGRTLVALWMNARQNCVPSGKSLLSSTAMAARGGESCHSTVRPRTITRLNAYTLTAVSCAVASVEPTGTS
jgi:hypothetical protein